MSATPILVSLETPGVEPVPMRPPGISFADAAEVSRALDALSSEHRTVLLLAVVEGFYVPRNMAQILDLPIGTVMSRLSRGRQAMRDRLTPAAPKVMQARAGIGRGREAE